MTQTISDAAFALFQAHRAGETKLTRRSGNFLGECLVDPSPLTEKQASWILALLEKAGLPAVDLEEMR